MIGGPLEANPSRLRLLLAVFAICLTPWMARGQVAIYKEKPIEQEVEKPAVQSYPKALLPYGESPTPTVTPVSTPAPTPRPVIILAPPTDEPIVAMVDNARYLTKAQMNNQVNRVIIMTEKVAPWDDKPSDENSLKPTAREKAISRCEEMVVAEWVERNVLATHAIAEGITVSPEELEEKLKEVYAAEQQVASTGTYSSAVNAIVALGISESEMKDYVRDAVLVEKLVQSRMSAFTESQLREVYDYNRHIFITPERVRLNCLSMAFEEDASLDDRRRLEKEMEGWYKDAAKTVKKGKKPEDKIKRFMEIADDFHNKSLGRRGGEMGWVTASSLPRDAEKGSGRILRAVSELEQGEITKILTGTVGFYVFQLAEFQEATGLTYESARDRVESVAYEKIREMLLADIKPRHTIVINQSGIDFDQLREYAAKTEMDRNIDYMTRRTYQIERQEEIQAILEAGRKARQDRETQRQTFSPEISQESIGILKESLEGAKEPKALE